MVGATAVGIGAFLATHVQPASADASDPVKLVAAVRRRSDLTLAQFYDYWLNTHAPVINEHLETLGATTYVQSHLVSSTLNASLAASHGTGTAYDGIAEVWFPSTTALVAAMATPHGIIANQKIADDEENFLDSSECSLFLTNEYVQLSGAANPLKLVSVLRRKDGMSRSQFKTYGINTHAPIAKTALTTLGATRYVQSHTTDAVLNTTIALTHGTGAAYDGITASWFPSESSLISALATTAGTQADQAVAANEKNFIKPSESSYFVTKEYQIF